jgi:hypothetical protein
VITVGRVLMRISSKCLVAKRNITKSNACDISRTLRHLIGER